MVSLNSELETANYVNFQTCIDNPIQPDQTHNPPIAVFYWNSFNLFHILCANTQGLLVDETMLIWNIMYI